MSESPPTPLVNDCQHADFEVVADVVRTEEQPSIVFRLNVIVRCHSCRQIFRFLGLPGGWHPSQPRVGAFGNELRAPIEPWPDVQPEQWEEHWNLLLSSGYGNVGT